MFPRDFPVQPLAIDISAIYRGFYFALMSLPNRGEDQSKSYNENSLYNLLERLVHLGSLSSRGNGLYIGQACALKGDTVI